MGGEVYHAPLVHAPDDRSIADDPIKMSHSTEQRFVFLDDIDVYDAKLIPFIDGHQIDGAERIAGNVCINRAQALFEDSRAPVKKSQNQLPANIRRIVQQKGSSGLSPLEWSLRGRYVGSVRFFSRSVGRLREEQVGNIFQSSSDPPFRSAAFLEGSLCDFLQLQVQVIEIRRSSAKMCSNQRPFASNSITESLFPKGLGSTLIFN